MDLDGRTEAREHLHHAEDGGRPRHVALHGGHALGGLEVQAAGVEGDALPDEGDPPAGAALGHVGEVDERGRLGAPAIDPQERAHAHPRAGLAIEDADPEAAGLGELASGLGEPGGGHAVGRLVDQVAGEARRLGGEVGDPQAFAQVGLVAGRRGEEGGRLDGSLIGPLGLVAVEGVQAEPEALADGLGSDARGEPRPDQRQDDVARPGIASPARRGRRGAAHRLCRASGARTEAHDKDAPRAEAAVGVEDGGVADLRLEALGGEDAAHEAAQGPVDAGDLGPEPGLVRVSLDHQHVPPRRRRGCPAHLELHRAPSRPRRSASMASARRIMGSSPTVRSRPARSSSVTQRRASASEPARAVPPAGVARKSSNT